MAGMTKNILTYRDSVFVKRINAMNESL